MLRQVGSDLGAATSLSPRRADPIKSPDPVERTPGLEMTAQSSIVADVTPCSLDVSQRNERWNSSKTPVRMRELSSSASVPAYAQSLLQRPPAMLRAGPPLKVPTFESTAINSVVQMSRYSPEPGHKSPQRAYGGMINRSPKGPSSRPGSVSPSPPPRRDGAGGVHRVVASYDLNTSCIGTPTRVVIPAVGAGALDTMDNVLRISQSVERQKSPECLPCI